MFKQSVSTSLVVGLGVVLAACAVKPPTTSAPAPNYQAAAAAAAYRVCSRMCVCAVLAYVCMCVCAMQHTESGVDVLVYVCMCVCLYVCVLCITRKVDLMCSLVVSPSETRYK